MYLPIVRNTGRVSSAWMYLKWYVLRQHRQRAVCSYFRMNVGPTPFSCEGEFGLCCVAIAAIRIDAVECDGIETIHKLRSYWVYVLYSFQWANEFVFDECFVLSKALNMNYIVQQSTLFLSYILYRRMNIYDLYLFSLRTKNRTTQFTNVGSKQNRKK